jgi:hypothetical protein
VPFLWVSLTPVLGWAATNVFIDRTGSIPGLPAGSGWDGYSYLRVELVLVAFAANALVVIGPLFLVDWTKRDVRASALAAGLLGLAQSLVPLLAVAATTDVVEAPSGRHYFRHSDEFLDYWPLDPILPLLFAVWVATLFVWALVALGRLYERHLTRSWSFGPTMHDEESAPATKED